MDLRLRSEAERNATGARGRGLFGSHTHRVDGVMYLTREARFGAGSRDGQGNLELYFDRRRHPSIAASRTGRATATILRASFSRGQANARAHAKSGKVDPGFGKEGRWIWWCRTIRLRQFTAIFVFAGANVPEQPAKAFRATRALRRPTGAKLWSSLRAAAGRAGHERGRETIGRTAPESTTGASS